MKILKLKRAFTLLEILIVVAILGLLVTLTMHNLLRARMTAYENTAKANLRVINSSCEGYRVTSSPASYPASLAELTTTNPPYIDSALASGQKLGYAYTYVLVNPNQYTCTASPTIPNITGTKTFIVDESGDIREQS